MKTEKVYLSLPISGYDEQERRQYAARTSGAMMWRYEGWNVVNPFHVASRVRKMKLEHGDWSQPSYEELMLHDIVALSECKKAVFCPGWELSDGCREEYVECLRRGVEIGFWDEGTETVFWKSRFGGMKQETADGQFVIDDYLGLHWA